MIKRNKILIIIAILLISSSVSFIFILTGVPVTTPEKEINDTDLPTTHNQSIKTDKANDSLYDHLSNRHLKVDDKLVSDEDKVALLSD